jgi:hypothetical protein
MADANQGSALEASGSKGAMGTSIAAGFQTIESPENTEVAQDQLRPTDKTTQKASRLSFASLYKGTPWPVDFGVSFGKTGDGEITRVGMTTQWTWVEIPRGPSLSNRLSYHKSYGYRSSDIQTTGFDILGGFGYGYIMGYASLGVVNHRASLDVQDTESVRLALTDPNNTVEQRTWQHSRGACGIQIKLGSPFITSTVEWTYSQTTYRGMSAKLSIGI